MSQKGIKSTKKILCVLYVILRNIWRQNRRNITLYIGGILKYPEYMAIKQIDIFISWKKENTRNPLSTLPFMQNPYIRHGLFNRSFN
jgi:hypothetical protein